MKSGSNEDCAGYFDLGRGDLVFMVADGVGGHPFGDQASRIVVTMMAQRLKKYAQGDELLGSVVTAVEKANEKIMNEIPGAASTVVVGIIQKRKLWLVHVGDSSLWLLGKKGKWKFSSVAQSPAGHFYSTGMIREKDLFFYEDRHAVYNLLGAPDSKYEIQGPIELSPRDTLFLCSDGISDNYYRKELADRVRLGVMSCLPQELMEETLRRMMMMNETFRGHPDDQTCLIYRPEGKGKGERGKP